MEYSRLKDIDVKSHLGSTIHVVFIAQAISVRPQSNGGEFMCLNMVDREKSVEAKIFGVTQPVKEKVIEGKVYAATVDVKPYKKNGVDTISCIITGMEESDIDPSTFADWVENLNYYIEELCKALECANGTIYGEIAKTILTKYWEKFVRWPAAKSQHHTQLGGLVWHTTTVVEAAKALGVIYQRIYGQNFINMPLLIAGAAIHDVMKTREFCVDATNGIVNYSVDAALSTHIMDVISEIDIEAAKRGIEYSEEIQLLKHLVASHHGKKEWGSPIECNIPEAFILHHADVVDATLWQYNKDMSGVEPGKYESVWRSGELVVRYKEKSKATVNNGV